MKSNQLITMGLLSRDKRTVKNPEDLEPREIKQLDEKRLIWLLGYRHAKRSDTYLPKEILAEKLENDLGREKADQVMEEVLSLIKKYEEQGGDITDPDAESKIIEKIRASIDQEAHDALDEKFAHYFLKGARGFHGDRGGKDSFIGSIVGGIGRAAASLTKTATRAGEGTQRGVREVASGEHEVNLPKDKD